MKAREIHLRGPQTQALNAACRRHSAGDFERDPAPVAGVVAAALGELLDPPQHAALAAYGTGDADVLIVRRGPRPEALGPTPRDGAAPSGDWSVGPLFLAGIMAAVGLRPVAYDSENAGQLVRHVLSRIGFEKTHSSHTGAAIGWHTESSDQPRYKAQDGVSPAPDALGFYALRNPSKLPTTVVTVDTLEAELAPDHWRALQAPWFGFRCSDSHSHRRSTQDIPLVVQRQGRWEMRYNQHTVMATDPRGEDALGALNRVLGQPELYAEVELSEGDVALLDNHRILHGRAAIPEDALARWLVRLYGFAAATEGLPVAHGPSHVMKVA